MPFDATTIEIAPPFAEEITRREAGSTPPARLLGQKGCVVGRTDQYVTAATATGDDDAELDLDVDPGAPLLVVHRTSFDADGRVVLRTVHRHPGDRTRIEVTFPTSNQLDGSPVVVTLEP